MKKKPAKKKPAQKIPPQQKLAPEKQQPSAAGRMLLMETVAEITPLDQASFCVMMFTHPESLTDEQREQGCTAIMKFAQVGWAAYHQLELSEMRTKAKDE